MNFRIILFFFAGVMSTLAASVPEPMNYDVVVYGGTPAGIASAIEAKRQGHTVVILEPSRQVGGALAGGVSMADMEVDSLEGISKEFYRRILTHYQDSEHLDANSAWGCEPKVALKVFQDMLIEAAIPVVYEVRLNRETGVRMHESRIREITMENGVRYAAKVFVDASYEGDLMAASKVTYVVGRESNDTYGENLNGIHYSSAHLPFVDPYKIPRNPQSGLLPGISRETPGPEGASDSNIPAYYYKLCLSYDPSNMAAISKPADYNPDNYTLMLRYIDSGGDGFLSDNQPVPNGKIILDGVGAWFSWGPTGGSKDYPDASYAEREGLAQRYRSYQQGLLWFLANDSRLPEEVREKAGRLGVPRDEFVDSDTWPSVLVMGEGRRMISDYVITEGDCRRLRVAPDPVGVSGRKMSSEKTSQYKTKGSRAHIRTVPLYR